MSDKIKKSLIIIYAVVFIVFGIIFFLIPFKRCTTDIIMYIFGLISVVGGYFITYSAFSKSEKGDIKSKVYGFPVFRIGYIYTIAQLVLSLIFFVIDMMYEMPVWSGALLCILLLAFAVIGTVVTDNARDIVAQTDGNTQNSTKTIEYFRLDINSLTNSCNNKEIKAKLEKLADKVRYSDPVSNSMLKDIESNIKTETEKLRELIKKEDVNSSKEAIGKIMNMVDERNELCKNTKGVQ